jgi:hypothetical protein
MKPTAAIVLMRGRAMHSTGKWVYAGMRESTPEQAGPRVGSVLWSAVDLPPKASFHILGSIRSPLYTHRRQTSVQITTYLLLRFPLTKIRIDFTAYVAPQFLQIGSKPYLGCL